MSKVEVDNISIDLQNGMVVEVAGRGLKVDDDGLYLYNIDANTRVVASSFIENLIILKVPFKIWHCPNSAITFE
jgi:hypothetical protein